jgi:HD-GYP domain-containing protein (c-di-GMP phosphodiesterase class II)
MVGTDVTPLLAAERRRRADLERTVAALSAAVETIDPHLAGHSQRVETLAIAVANRLQLDDDARTTVQLAARVSQIGKLGIDRDVVAAEHRHSDAEREAMRQHVANADRILARIDFRLPVRETVVQMHERLDGTGYPQGLEGEAIMLTARVLGAADVFCARTAPRSYRPGISAGEALGVLRAHPERYDARVVEALAEAVDAAGALLDA